MIKLPEQPELPKLTKAEKSQFAELKTRIAPLVPKSEVSIKEAIDKAEHPIEVVRTLIEQYGFNKELYPDWLQKVEAEFPEVKSE